MLKPLIVLCGALVLGACVVNERVSTAGATARPASTKLPTPSSNDYLAMTAAHDLFQMESAQLAVRRTKNSGIYSYGLTMIDHYHASKMRFEEAADWAGLRHAPGVMAPEKRQTLARLEAVPAEDFDQAYLDVQLFSLVEGLDIHKSYVGDGETSHLRWAGAAVVPVIEQHIQYVRTLSSGQGSGRRE